MNPDVAVSLVRIQFISFLWNSVQNPSKGLKKMSEDELLSNSLEKVLGKSVRNRKWECWGYASQAPKRGPRPTEWVQGRVWGGKLKKRRIPINRMFGLEIGKKYPSKNSIILLKPSLIHVRLILQRIVSSRLLYI